MSQFKIFVNISFTCIKDIYYDYFISCVLATQYNLSFV